MLRLVLVASFLCLVGAATAWGLWSRVKDMRLADLDAAWAAPLPAPELPLRVYHLGHSLVGRDMPAMLAQLAGQGHDYRMQLGWGTSLREHWEPDLPVNGFETENAHDRFRDAREALSSGEFDAVVLTEMVELRDAIRYHDSATYLPLWADLARQGNPDARVYLYETWHRLDDPDGWLERIDTDWRDNWRGTLLAADGASAMPMRVIPAGRVMAEFVRVVEAQGGTATVANRTDLFARDAKGGIDPIHMGDQGAYLVALTHYAVLTHRSPIGLPTALLRADGTPALAPDPETARLMQETVWQVVRSLPETGVAP
jgi:hypothetical protein